MATPASSLKPARSWRRIALISFSAGAGFFLTWAVAVGIYLWYSSRPKPAAPWNTTAVVATDPSAGFLVSDDGKWLRLEFSVSNTTDNDYRLEPSDSFRFVYSLRDGTYSPPLGEDAAKIEEHGVFIPPKHKSLLMIDLNIPNLPAKDVVESDDDFHESLRAFLKEHYSHIGGFVLFDDAHRYQLNLPVWRSEAPIKKRP